MSSVWARGHAHVGAPADAGFGVQAGYVARAVTDKREGFFGEGSEHQLALLPVRQHLAGVGIDYLGQEVVFVNVQTTLGLHALTRDARPTISLRP